MSRSQKLVPMARKQIRNCHHKTLKKIASFPTSLTVLRVVAGRLMHNDLITSITNMWCYVKNWKRIWLNYSGIPLRFSCQKFRCKVKNWSLLTVFLRERCYLVKERSINNRCNGTKRSDLGQMLAAFDTTVQSCAFKVICGDAF